ncbi:hypothetical protein [Phyllobacterium sp. CL33Tsu]|uniref:hypothetical protein n=1 Tax=Phyllobacterium sp. CL33Tsu TaxID=1798191 RepID=UPI000B8551DF|nr:hypothetical protein [Phyllobacterium sp. CL33Tsu]
MSNHIADDHPDNQAAASQLQTIGHFNDEEFYGYQLVEDNGVEIERAARLFGYVGGEIKIIGIFGKFHGAVCLAYDSDHLSYEDARDVLLTYISTARDDEI